MKIVQCKVNHLVNPLGYQMNYPVFSWQVTETKGKRQTRACIRVSLQETMEDCCVDTGMIAGLNHVASEIRLDMKPRVRYYWTVTVQTDASEEETSDVNWFETGKKEEPWYADWITCEAMDRHPVFEKQIDVSQKVVSARLYICGLGAYEVSINGKKVSDEFLAPYCNNYENWLQYQTYDVTNDLEWGGLIQVMLGNGWARSRFGYWSKAGDKSYYNKPMELIAELHLRFQDGSNRIIGTDKSWKVRRSTIIFSGIYDGEPRDDSLCETEVETVQIIEEETPLVERFSVPVRIQERLKPVELIHTPAGEQVMDLGQNMTGIFRLRVKEPAGTRIHLQFGEILQNGNFYRGNLRTALAEYIYVSNGTEQVIEPHFTFFGYRYVKIEGITNLCIDDFEGLAVYSSLEEIGQIRTGNEKVNRLIQNAEWGLRSNFLDVPTDCPQRDERMGWTGDAQVFSATACFLRGCYPFYRKYLHDMETEQKCLDGKVPNIIPSFGYHDTASVWGDAACIIPWNLYLFTGDLSILREQFDSMKSWVNYIRRIDGTDHSWRKRFHFGDWLALDNPFSWENVSLGGTDEGYIADIYYAYSAELTAKAAQLLKRKKEAEEYAALSEDIRGGIREEFFSPNGRCCVNTQTALLLALRFRLIPDETVCREMLRKKMKETRGKLQTGFVGTPILCSQLTVEGMESMAWDLLLNEEYFHMVF